MGNEAKSILIWGGGGHGHVVIDLLHECENWNPVGIIDSEHPVGTSIMGIPVLGNEEELPALYQQGLTHLVVAVGQSDARAQMVEKARALGFDMPSLIHPSCIVSPSAQMADACVLCAGSIIGARTVLGTGVILNTRSVVDHDNQIGDFSHVAPGGILCGTVTVGSHTWIGAGSIIRDHLSIGREVMIGAGSLVLKDIPDGQTAYGSPAVCKEKETP